MRLRQNLLTSHDREPRLVPVVPMKGAERTRALSRFRKANQYLEPPFRALTTPERMEQGTLLHIGAPFNLLALVFIEVIKLRGVN
jgi:hypothetical protein